MPSTVAVIDIGSNSIKILLAGRDASGAPRSLGMKTLDARISAGISRSEPRLSEEGMQRGLAAVTELLDYAAPYQPEMIRLVATSAVRGATNGAEFCQRVQAATGHEIRVLSGLQEANYIGRGLTADPVLRHLQDFYVFDLGGGSLECLAFRQRQIQQAQSFPLGCVRLTERFVADPSLPVTTDALQAIAAHTRQSLEAGSFRFDLAPAEAVFAGGTLTTARIMLGRRQQLELEETSAELSVAALRDLLEQVRRLPLAPRKELPGLPPGRADVFPTALATTLAVAELAQVEVFHHSLYNLRWGLATELLHAG
jgi:exopolyphosphatase / guanosine-5'-triphosphate,3'-diphosphate pyrophosphatase